MEAKPERNPAGAIQPPGDAHFVHEAPTGDVPAWEEVEDGRFMPRRIRGSCKGRALG